MPADKNKPAPDPIEDAVVLILARGLPDQIAIKHCAKSGIETKRAKQIIARARKRITLAADYKRDEQVGMAVIRLGEIYTKAAGSEDWRTALQAQREINKLMSLYDNYDEDGPTQDDGASHRRLELIASYLLPLELLTGNYPIEEHARVAAEKIRHFRDGSL